MIRLLIAGLMLLIVNNAHAMTNESLIKYCKKYVNNNFQMTTENSFCMTYFIAVRDTGIGICEAYKIRFSELTKREKWIYETFAIHPEVDVKAAVRNYLDTLSYKNIPFTAAHYVRMSLQKGRTCKTE